MSSIASGTTTTTALVQTADTTGNLLLQTGSTPTTAVTIDTSQNVGVGVTPTSLSTTYKAVQVGLTGSFYGRTNAEVYLANNWQASATGDKYITTGYATYYGQYSGTHVWNIAASGIAGNTITFTQAMTLDNSGNLLVGTTTARAIITSEGNLASVNTFGCKDSGTTYGSSSYYAAFINVSNGVAGSIQHTALSTVNYATSSDSRLKNDIGVAEDTSVIDSTVIHDFSWKHDGLIDRGVFAQEAHLIKPTAIGVGSDELTEDGNLANPWSVDYSKYVPDLIVYCQQLKKQVIELSAKVTALEAKVA
jgi:hypothetical protein